jgi:SAM-dependent methyltransferase
MKFSRRAEMAALMAKIDPDRLRQIQRRHAGSDARYAKYSDVEHWLAINLPRVQELKLEGSAPKEILDLGCGAGFFLFLAKQAGHSGVGVDVGDYPLSNDLIDLFGVDKLTWRIRAFEPLPDLGRRFDLITAFSAAFNRNHDEARGWNAEEWEFFLNDLKRHAKPDSQILLEINSGKDGRYFLPEIRDFLIKRGARVEGERVYFEII